jgi:hypothetical protein
MSRLRFAAEEVGISADTLTRGMRILSKHLIDNDAAAKSLGITYRDAKGNVLPTVDVIANLSDKFASMPPGLERTALAVKAFGRAGTEMLPILALGGDKVKELAAEADKLGLTLSGKDSNAVKDYTMKQRELHAAIQGVQLTVGRELVPQLTVMTQYIIQNVIPVAQAFAAGLTGKGGVVDGMNKTAQGAYNIGAYMVATMQTLYDYRGALEGIAAVMAVIWTASKVVAAARAMTAAIGLLSGAYAVLTGTASAAAVAEGSASFGLGTAAIIGAGVAVAGGLAAAIATVQAKAYQNKQRSLVGTGTPSYIKGTSGSDTTGLDNLTNFKLPKLTALHTKAAHAVKTHAVAQKALADNTKMSADEIARLNAEIAKMNASFSASNSWLAAQTRTTGPTRDNFGGFVEVPVIVDGQVLFRSVQKFSLLNNRRNVSNGLAVSGSTI